MWCYLYLGLIFKVLLFSISMERLIDQQFESPYCCPGRITRSLGKAGICWSAGCNKLSCSLVSHLRDASRCQLLWAVYFPDTHSAVNIFLFCIWKFSFHVGRELVGSKSQTPNSLVFAVRSYYHLHHYFIDFSMFFMLLLFICLVSYIYVSEQPIRRWQRSYALCLFLTVGRGPRMKFRWAALIPCFVHQSLKTNVLVIYKMLYHFSHAFFRK